MKAIFGIGNPGVRYQLTKHNVGFFLLDFFAEKNKIKFRPSKFDYYEAELNFNENISLLIKPTTYVNLTGRAVKQFLDIYQLQPSDFLVIVDDINLPLGSYRLRRKGKDGGHNGLASIIYEIENDDFPRLRIGIGNSFEKGQMADYVLSPFSEEEIKNLYTLFDSLILLLNAFLIGGIDEMLNQNSKLSNKKDNN